MAVKLVLEVKSRESAQSVVNALDAYNGSFAYF